MRVDEHVRRAQQVTGVDELDLDACDDLDLLAERVHGLKRDSASAASSSRVERQRRVMLGEAALVGELRVFFLQVRGVGQHQLAQIGGAGGAIDRALESLRDQPRQPARSDRCARA